VRLPTAAIRRRHTALYLRASRMLDELAIARVDGRLARLTASWARIDVLVIDDFLLRSPTPDQAADTLEVIEDRAGSSLHDHHEPAGSRGDTRPCRLLPRAVPAFGSSVAHEPAVTCANIPTGRTLIGQHYCEPLVTVDADVGR